jgi:uncharacterized protein
MLDRLPGFIDPLLYAERARELDGEIELSQFERLSDILANQIGTVIVKLSFYKEKKLASIVGEITANLNLECQNCLKVLPWSYQTTFRLGLVQSLDEANRLPSGYEPLLINNQEKIALTSIIEEELLLTIPEYPKHGHNCLDIVQYRNKEIRTDIETTKPENPFSVLATLKKSGD